MTKTTGRTRLLDMNLPIYSSHRQVALSSILIALTFIPNAHANTWKTITKSSETPKQVIRILSDCSFVQERKTDWLNGDNLALIELGIDKKLWFSTCETSASQIYSAFVLESNDGFSRVMLQQYLDGKLDRSLDVVAGARWLQSNKTLTSIISSGCASNAGARYTWKWNGSSFSLTEQAESDDCVGEKNWPVVYRGK